MIETVEIERMSYGDEAVAHLSNGKTVFVKGAVAGDVVEIQILEDKKKFARAEILKIVHPSSVRVDVPPSLPLSIAPWANMSYDAQLIAKESNVRAALVKTAHLPKDVVDEILQPVISAPDELNYRNKIEMAAFRSSDGQLQLGFHDNADAVSAFTQPTLAIADKKIAKSPKALTGALRYILGDEDCGLFRVGVRASAQTGSVEVTLWTNPCSWPRSFSAKVLSDAICATSIVRVIAEEGRARKVKRVEVLDGDGFWSEIIPSSGKFVVQAPSFFQVNTAQASKLVELVVAALSETALSETALFEANPSETGTGSFRRSPSSEGFCNEKTSKTTPSPKKILEGMYIADLYSGVGTFSVALARAGADVCAIELAGFSARDLEKNAQLNDVDIDVICDDTARALPILESPDAIVVDPPKAGLSPEVIDQIADTSANTVVYVSCDPQTFARDVVRFAQCGYELKSVQPVDLFPQTWHIECVSVFKKASKANF